MMKRMKSLLGVRSRPLQWNRRVAGDQARDAKDWQTAAAAYADYLTANPDDWPIWVQRGHSLKESGDLAGAERAYRRAADLAPQQADPFFHLGWIMNKQGRRPLAIEYFQRAAALGDTHAIKDLRDLGIEIEFDSAEPTAVLPWITVQALTRTLLDARAARDLRRWDEAEALYAAYLQARPNSEPAMAELAFVREVRRR